MYNLNEELISKANIPLHISVFLELYFGTPCSQRNKLCSNDKKTNAYYLLTRLQLKSQPRPL